MRMININQAMQAIKNEYCCECGKRAKGLIFRRHTVHYYCKKCLSEYENQKNPESVAV